MGNNISKEELQTRREFFKKAAKGILPMLGVFVAGPTIMMSTLTSCGCDGCEATCMDNCDSSCTGSCSQSCSYGCGENCEGTCSSACEGTATGRPTTGSIDRHEYVDLGLSVLWAKFNIGSSSTDDAGTRFPFVFPEEEDDDVWLQRIKSLNLSWDDSISGTDLDTAKNKWGRKWRLPHRYEFEELVRNCKTEFASTGVKFTSKINGESIIFPLIRNLAAFDGTAASGNVWADACEVVGYLSGKNRYIYADGLIIERFVNNGETGEYVYATATIKIYTKDYVTATTDRKIECLPIRPVAERNEGNVSSCNGTCTANCSSDCTGTCKTACSSCKGACEGCTASCKTDCTGGCGTNCTGGCKATCTKTCADTCASDCTGGCSTGCSSTCKGTCSGGCSSGCSGGCKGTCSGSCGSGCSGSCSSCTATCADSCKAQTSQGCSNCATQCSGDCNHECTYGCGRQCYTSCGGNCKGKCGGNCYVECTSYSKNTPCSSCGGTCRSSCNENCTYDCYSTCQSIGYK